MSAWPGLHRNRIECEDHDFLMDLVDELIPYTSGRLYREQKMTTRKFYKIYMQRCEEAGQIPLSLSFISTQGTVFTATTTPSLIIASVLANKRIHHVNNPAACPYCQEYDNFFAGQDPNQDTPQQQQWQAFLEGYRELAHAQRVAFGKDRVWLQQGANN